MILHTQRCKNLNKEAPFLHEYNLKHEILFCADKCKCHYRGSVTDTQTNKPQPSPLDLAMIEAYTRMDKLRRLIEEKKKVKNDSI